MSRQKPRIGTIPYVDEHPMRVSVYNSDYDEFGARVSRLRRPWVVEVGGDSLGSYPTHESAMARVARLK